MWVCHIAQHNLFNRRKAVILSEAYFSGVEGPAVVLALVFDCSSSTSLANRRLNHIPAIAKIVPSRIALLDQGDLFRTSPSLQLLLPPNRAFRTHEPLKPDQTIAVVLRRESRMHSLLMLEDSLQQIAGHADVERVAPARHDVCAIDPLVHGKDCISINRRLQSNPGVYLFDETPEDESNRRSFDSAEVRFAQDDSCYG